MTQSAIPLRVMVIDDEKPVRLDLIDIVESFIPREINRPVEVRGADGVEGVIEILQSGWIPDFVYLDNNLEGEHSNDGEGLREVAPAFEALYAAGTLTRRVPVVMVTAGDLAESGERRFAALERTVSKTINVVGLVRKPYKIDEIVLALTNNLSGSADG